MNSLFSLGLILLLALLAGHLVKVLRVPEVTGYLLAGVALGPSVLGWVSHENLQALEVLSEVALGLILFSIGSVFEISSFLETGRRLVYLTLSESVLAAGCVTASMLAVGQPWVVALMFGAMAIETAPASTLMVIREMRGTGPLSETLTRVMAIDNLFCITAFLFVSALLDFNASMELSTSVLDAFYRAIYPLIWQILGSVALGFLVGLMLTGWATQMLEQGEILILLAGSILLCVGAARLLNLFPLVSSLAVGASMVNLSPHSRRLFRTLSRMDPPFYAIFFVIAGADLNVAQVAQMGPLGIIYVIARASGKFIGARTGAWWQGFEPTVAKNLGFALMAQAGLAIGITLTINRRYPEYSPVITTVILSSIVVYEIVGPLAVKYAIVRAGESQVRKGGSDSVWAID